MRRFFWGNDPIKEEIKKDNNEIIIKYQKERNLKNKKSLFLKLKYALQKKLNKAAEVTEKAFEAIN